MTEDQKFDLLKRINSKMGWALFFLVCITLNTCSVADDLKDAVRPDRQAETPVTAPATPAPAP